MPSTAVIVRSMLNVQSGARTRMSQIIVSVSILASVSVLAPGLSQIPIPCLSGVLIAMGLNMLRNRELKQVLQSENWKEISVFVITFSSLLTQGLLTGVAIGMVSSFVLTLGPVLRQQRLLANKLVALPQGPQGSETGVVKGGGKGFCWCLTPADPVSNAMSSSVAEKIVALEGVLSWLSVSYIQEMNAQILAVYEHKHIQTTTGNRLVFEMGQVQDMDLTAADLLVDLWAELEALGVELRIQNLSLVLQTRLFAIDQQANLRRLANGARPSSK